MSHRRFLFIVLVIAFLGPFASDIYLPSLPSMAEYFESSETAMQLSITLYFFGLAVFQLFWGPFSDKMGRKVTLVVGALVALGGCLICLFAPNALILNVGRFIQGGGGAASASLGRSVLRDRFEGAQLSRAMGIFGIFYALVPSLAPIMGGYIEEAFGWQANFILLGALTVYVIFFTLSYFPESIPEYNPRALKWDHLIGNYKTVLKNKNFWGYSIGASMGYAGDIAFLTVSPFLLQSVLGLTPGESGFTILAITLGMATGNLLNAKLVKRFGIENMLVLGFFIMFLGGAFLLGCELNGVFTLQTITLSTYIFMTGAAFLFSSGGASALQPFGFMAGSAAAMFGFLQLLGTSIVSFIISFSSDTSGWDLGLTYVSLAWISYASYKLLVTPAENRKVEQPR